MRAGKIWLGKRQLQVVCPSSYGSGALLRDRSGTKLKIGYGHAQERKAGRHVGDGLGPIEKVFQES